jgi:acetyltransferase-like isoleucine patch superfamily enzyme
VFSHNYFLNPRRAEERSSRERLKAALQAPFVQFGLWLGFQNIEYSYVHGDKRRVILGRGVSTMNTIFNVISGTVRVGDHTIFTHNCMVLSGTHQFIAGKRAGLHVPPLEETPTTGRDITIGAGCFIGSGSIILGPVTIGDNVIIGAGAVVTSDIPSGCFVAGSPAKVIHVF